MVNIHENVYARRGVDGRAHIPALPFWVAIIRIFQVLLAFIIMILTAYSFNTFGDYISSTLLPGYAFSFFVFAWTVVFILYIFVTPLFFPKFYLYWVHLGLEVLTTIFWMTTFALLADELKWWSLQQRSLRGSFYYDFKTKRSGFNTNIDAQEAAIGASRAATGLSAINWLLFCVTVVTFGIFLHKHRLENGSGGSGFAFPRKTGDAEAAGQQEKIVYNQPVELRDAQHQHPQYPQPTAAAIPN